jgi:hypothetical protein
VEARQQSSVTLLEGNSIAVLNPATKRTQTFDFDRVFGDQSSQDQVFEEVRPVLTSVLDGFHVCIFAYGQVLETALLSACSRARNPQCSLETAPPDVILCAKPVARAQIPNPFINSRKT